MLHQVVTAQLAAARAGTQSTKTRAEVRGGGAKPFRQKGTGRARQGSSRSPSMSGGGVALGPKPRSYAQHTPKKMVRLALLSALSDRAEIGRVVVVDDWKITAPKTKDAATILRKLKLNGLGPGRRWPTTSSTSSAPSPTCPRRRRRPSPSSRPTTCCGPTGCSSPTAPCPTAASDFSGTHVVDGGRRRAQGRRAPRPRPSEAERGARRQPRREGRQAATEVDERPRRRRPTAEAKAKPRPSAKAEADAPSRRRDRGGRRRCVTPCPC